MANIKEKKAGEGPDGPDGLDMPGPSREEYVASVLQQIGDLEERLDELESGMESSGWDDIGEYRGQLDDLRLKLKAARTSSEELEAVSDQAWPAAHEEMEETLGEIVEGVEDFARILGLVLPE